MWWNRGSVPNARSRLLRLVASRKSLKACHRCRCFYWQTTDKHLHPPVENSSTSHFLNAGKQSIGYFARNRVSRESRTGVSSRGEKLTNNAVVRHARCLMLTIQQYVIFVEIGERGNTGGNQHCKIISISLLYIQDINTLLLKRFVKTYLKKYYTIEKVCI